MSKAKKEVFDNKSLGFDQLRHQAVLNHIRQTSAELKMESKSIRFKMALTPPAVSENLKSFCGEMRKQLYNLHLECQKIHQTNTLAKTLESVTLVAAVAVIASQLGKALNIDGAGSTAMVLASLSETKDLLKAARLKAIAGNFLQIINSKEKMAALSDAIIGELAYQFEELINLLQISSEGTAKLARWFVGRVATMVWKDDCHCENENQLAGKFLLYVCNDDESLRQVFIKLISFFKKDCLALRSGDSYPLKECLFLSPGIIEDGSIYIHEDVPKPFFYPLRKLPSHSYATSQRMKKYYEFNYAFLRERSLELHDVDQEKKITWDSKEGTVLLPVLDIACLLPLETEAKLYELRDDPTHSWAKRYNNVISRAGILKQHGDNVYIFKPHVKQNQSGNLEMITDNKNIHVHGMHIINRVRAEYSVFDKISPAEWKLMSLTKEKVMRQLNPAFVTCLFHTSNYWNSIYFIKGGVVCWADTEQPIAIESKLISPVVQGGLATPAVTSSSGLDVIPDFEPRPAQVVISPDIWQQIIDMVKRADRSVDQFVDVIAKHTGLSHWLVKGFLVTGITLVMSGGSVAVYKAIQVGVTEAVTPTIVAFLGGGILTMLTVAHRSWVIERVEQNRALGLMQLQLQSSSFISDEDCMAMEEGELSKEEELFAAAYSGKHADVERLLQGGVSADTIDKQGETALFTAVRGNDARIVKTLLEYKASVNYTNSSKSPVLFFAVQKGKVAVPVVQELLNARADVAVENENGLSPLDMAEMKAHKEREDSVLQLLLKENPRQPSSALFSVSPPGGPSVSTVGENKETNVLQQVEIALDQAYPSGRPEHAKVRQEYLEQLKTCQSDPASKKNKFVLQQALNKLRLVIDQQSSAPAYRR